MEAFLKNTSDLVSQSSKLRNGAINDHCNADAKYFNLAPGS